MKEYKFLQREDYFNKFGLPLKRFCIRKYGSVKNAAEVLSIQPAQLSQYINGHKYPSRKFEEELRKDGFDMSLFDKIRTEQELANRLDATDGSGLTWEQLKFLIAELKSIIMEKNSTIDILKRTSQHQEERIKELKKNQY